MDFSFSSENENCLVERVEKETKNLKNTDFSIEITRCFHIPSILDALNESA